MEGSKQVDNNNNTTPFCVCKIRPGFIYLGSTQTLSVTYSHTYATKQFCTHNSLLNTAVFSVVTQHWGGALGDPTKNICEADYTHT